MTQLVDTIERIVRARLAELVLSCPHVARVESDEGDSCTVTILGGALDSQVLRKVGKSNGLPKTISSLSAGTRVLIQFAGANATAPFITGFLQDTPAQRIEIFSRGRDASGLGDGVDCGTLVFNPGSGAAALSFIPPGGPVPPPVGPVLNIPLTGKISEGNPNVRI